MRQLNNIPELTKDRKINNNNFWINDIPLFVPPTNISIHKEGLNYSVKSLRTKSSVKMASGNGVYHLQINLVFPPDSLLQLHRLICQIKNNPFVFIENDFIKQSIENNVLDNINYIYATLMGMNITNHPSSPGSFIVELDLRYFNERVYAENLGFKRDDLYSFVVGNKILGISFDIFDADIINVVREEAKLTKEKTIRFIEQSLSKELSSKPLSTVKVGHPKDSLVYRRYCNFLQILYLKKYFNIDIKRQTNDSESGFIAEEDNAIVYLNKPLSEALNSGEVGLHDVFQNRTGKFETNFPDNYLLYMRQRIIHAMYLTSKYTRVFYRNFATLDISSAEQKEIRKLVNKGVRRGMTSEEKYNIKRKNLENLSKRTNNAQEAKVKAEEELSKPYDFRSSSFRNMTSDFKDIVDIEETESLLGKDTERIINFVAPLKDEMAKIGEFCDFFETGSFRKLTGPLRKDVIYLECIYDKAFTVIILPCNSKVKISSRKDGFHNIAATSEDNDEYFFERIKIPYAIAAHYDDPEAVYAKGSVIGFADGENPFIFKCSESFFKKIPFYQEYIESLNKRKTELEETDNFLKNLERKFKFINSSYQKYLGRKEVENVFVKENQLDILDHTDYEINLISNMTEGFKDDDFTHGDKTVIANLSGSLRHIVASIPILGMDSPTHQFLGSIEPSYQFNLVGKKGIYPMPLTFLELEKLRSDSQKFAKSFSIVPGASFIAVESMITKLLGSYEKSYRQIYEIGGDDYTFMQIQEKYNFSINSLDTFTMDGQPNAMGMNFRFDETRDYNEEEIRPAFTNEVSSEKLNDLYKTLIEGISAPNKSNAVSLNTNSSSYKRVRTQSSNYDESQWGNWTTKHYVADEYYSKIRRINRKYPNLYHPKTVNEYMEFFNKNKQDDWLHPDKSAYYICLVLSQMQDYFNELYGDKNKMIIFSAIRYENRPNMYRVKRNRLNSQGEIIYKTIKKPFSEIDNSFIENSQVRKEVAIKPYRSMHYAGGAVDIYYPGQNATEVLIYIYLMMLFNFIEDPVPNAKRTGRFLGLGIYGLDSHVRDSLMASGIGRNGFIHIDLNYMLEFLQIFGQ